ncbi:MAG: acyl-CoA dehydrogenase [Holophagales bacterium]|nr:acyl-CoA dehydrogenase [Holophagales bacterium]MYG30047.1 acyl-CoA dehydrogenase [Holophagales bacterium]MYI78726.1 acyl-CoA dehydrogenase [Holophagales bacterium]
MNDISPAAVGYMTPEREMLRRIARDFTDKEVLPVANELDPKKETIPQSLIDQMGELGFFGIVIPEEYGGAGLGAFEYCLVAEELARGWMSVASIIARGNGFYRSIPFDGEERLKRIRLMAEGKYLGALAMSEPEVGSDISSITCRARVEDDHWVITGNKYWCTFADGANFIQVIARTEGDPAKRHAALTGIGIEKPPGELPEGVTGSPIPKIGYHGWKTWELHFENVRVPITKQQRESKGQAFYGMTRGLQTARAHTAARSIGLAQGALEQAIAYSKERIQFRRPIADFQAIRFKIANMAAEVEAARQLNYSVCAKIDTGVSCAKEAAMVKYYAAEMSERVCSDALQVLAGAGYTTDYPVERYWRDARLTKIFEGTSEIMLKIVSDELLGKPSRRS